MSTILTKKKIGFLKRSTLKQRIKTLKIWNIVRRSEICVIEILREKKGEGVYCRNMLSRYLEDFPKADDVH